MPLRGDRSFAINDHRAEEGTMNCFECAKANDAVPAVATCNHCGVGLCLDHLVEARQYRVGGTLMACAHNLPSLKQLRGVPAGIANGARHTSAAR
jgi:hypothetical protein